MTWYKTKHIFQIHPSIIPIIRAEQNPTYHKDKDAINMLDNIEPLCGRLFMPTRHFFNNDEESVPKSPNDKCPISSMPKTSQQKHNAKIHIGTILAFSVSSQRNIKILLKPCRQRDVPSTPKLRDGF